MSANKTTSQLSRMERQRQALEHKIKLLQRKALLALPARVGLDSMDSLILALVQHASPAMKARFKTAGIVGPLDASGNGHSNSARAKFSTELRDLIKRELEAGKKSVAEISREFGPSHPTIMGWKREWGMTRPRTRRSPRGGGGNGGGRD